MGKLIKINLVVYLYKILELYCIVSRFEPKKAKKKKFLKKLLQKYNFYKKKIIKILVKRLKKVFEYNIRKKLL